MRKGGSHVDRKKEDVPAVDVENCLRCGAVLWTDLDLETGICADCWTPDDEED